MTEVSLYRLLRNQTPHIHWQRIENGVGVGAFDINGCTEGKEFWIELKIGNPGPLLRFTQYAWGNRRHREGGKVWLICYKEKEKSLCLYKPPFSIKTTPSQKLLCERTVNQRKKYLLNSNPVATFEKPWNFETIIKEHILK